jgi:hypothetical protein
VLDAEALLGACDARKNLLREHGRVGDADDFAERDVASPAALGDVRLIEVGRERRVTAADGGREAAHVFEQALRVLDALRIGVASLALRSIKVCQRSTSAAE